MGDVNSMGVPETRARGASSSAPSGSRWWIWLLVLALAGGGYWYFRGRSSSHAQDSQAAPGAGGAGRRGAGGMGAPVVPVVAAQAQRSDLPVYFNGLGTVTAFNTVTVRSRVDGQIVKINFTEGQFVNTGDSLVEIDPRPFQVMLEQAEGQLAKDQAQRKDAEVNLERFQLLFKEGVIPKQQLDTQAAQVGQFDGAIRSDQGQIDNAKLQIAYCHITAPISGRVGLRLVDPGNVVNSGSSTTLAVITQLQPITVVFTISEDNLQQVLSQLHKNQSLLVQAFDRAQSKLLSTGKLLTTDNLIDTTTGTVKMRAVFDNKDNALFPNQFVNTRLLVDTLHDVVLVDSSSIQHNGTQAFVWVIQDGKAQTRNITTGATDNNLTQVTGLNAGEVVAGSSFEKLQNGSKVNVVQQQGPQGQGQNQNQSNQPGQNNGQHQNKSGKGKPNGSKSQ